MKNKELQILQQEWIKRFQSNPPNRIETITMVFDWYNEAEKKPKQMAKVIQKLEKLSQNNKEEKKPLFTVGTKIIKTWRGKRYEVIVMEDGFTYKGKNYKSLTAIAKTITGRHQSGYLFFNLRTRGKAIKSSKSLVLSKEVVE